MWHKSKVKLKRSILQETIIIILEIAILDEYIRQVFSLKYVLFCNIMIHSVYFSVNTINFLPFYV